MNERSVMERGANEHGINEQTVVTPTVRRVIRRSLFWIGAAVAALLIAVLSLGIAGTAVEGPRLSPENAAPTGAKALAEVLRKQGVEVISTSSLAATRGAISEPSNTTLFLVDADSYLDDAQLAEAAGLADRVIIADPGFLQLRALAPGVNQAGKLAGSITANCTLPELSRVQTISGETRVYRDGADEAAARCFGDEESGYSLIQFGSAGQSLTILGATGALTNGAITNDDNAAFALTVLGAEPRLVWYLPSLDDVPAGDGNAFADLTPGWVTPVMLLLVMTFIAAAVWQGRRFGPLVIENLPVTVRSSETMQGRARLYERSSARVRALDALRVGTIRRLGVLCGLPSIASVDEVVLAVASVTDTQVPGLRSLLVEAVPHSDGALIGLSDALLRLERDVARAVRPSSPG
ncbi:MAG: DUF4350 domain-containing protein [Salinibacterium sp.]|nr:DUF4350 domain-containing protein [Salinibacterium sp.]